MAYVEETGGAGRGGRSLGRRPAPALLLETFKGGGPADTAADARVAKPAAARVRQQEPGGVRRFGEDLELIW